MKLVEENLGVNPHGLRFINRFLSMEHIARQDKSK